MKGDFTRWTHDPRKHYTKLFKQQGRVDLDSEWNEQQEISSYERELRTKDFAGLCGTPKDAAGFKISIESDRLKIGPGRYYVDGMLCVHDPKGDEPVYVDDQPHLPPVKPPPTIQSLLGGAADTVQKALVYLDMWERHVTALDDSRIREVALGGADTTARVQTIWQVKVKSVSNGASEDVLLRTGWELTTGEWKTLVRGTRAGLMAQTEPPKTTQDPCLVSQSAGYRGLENQLYRVEIHRIPPSGKTTFKWSRDNGSVVARWDDQDGNKLTVSNAGRDRLIGFSPGQWIELTDDTREFQGLPGVLVQLSAVDGNVLTIDPATRIHPDVPDGGTQPPIKRDNFPRNPKVRRWDAREEEEKEENRKGEREIPSKSTTWIDLDDGIQIRFPRQADQFYLPGDYWLIAARTATGDVEWPAETADGRIVWRRTEEEGKTDPLPQPPLGIYHHYCALAVVYKRPNGTLDVKDTRELFPPLTDLTRFACAGGDGQEAMPGQPLPKHLRVVVTRWLWPVRGALVKFRITEGVGGTLDSDTLESSSPPEIQVRTNSAGVAECEWQLDDDPDVQQVEATLLLPDGPAVTPIVFTANLSRASRVSYSSVNACDALNAALAGVQTPWTVQDVLDRLCHGENIGYDTTNTCYPLNAALALAGIANPSVQDALERLCRADGIEYDKANACDALNDALAGVAHPTVQQALEKLCVADNIDYTPDGACSGLGEVDTVAEALNRLCQAANIAYAPECSYLQNENATTVQAALDALCNRTVTEPGIVVEALETFDTSNAAQALQYGRQVRVDHLVKGIRAMCSNPVVPSSVQQIPTCYLTLYTPVLSGANLIGKQPLILEADVTAPQVAPEGPSILWKPTAAVETWLMSTVFAARTESVLAKFTLEGNFIWADVSVGEGMEQQYLDGELFGLEGAGELTDLRFPSGDGRKGGKLEVWFWAHCRPSTVVFDPSPLRMVGLGLVEGTFVLKNSGDEVMNVQGVSLTGPAGPVFSWALGNTLPLTPFALPPRSGRPGKVQFNAGALPAFSLGAMGTVTVTSDDPDFPVKNLSLIGSKAILQIKWEASWDRDTFDLILTDTVVRTRFEP